MCEIFSVCVCGFLSIVQIFVSHFLHFYTTFSTRDHWHLNTLLCVVLIYRHACQPALERQNIVIYTSRDYQLSPDPLSSMPSAKSTALLSACPCLSELNASVGPETRYLVRHLNGLFILATHFGPGRCGIAFLKRFYCIIEDLVMTAVVYRLQARKSPQEGGFFLPQYIVWLWVIILYYHFVCNGIL